jgi:hypothetical protein
MYCTSRADNDDDDSIHTIDQRDHNREIFLNAHAHHACASKHNKKKASS